MARGNGNSQEARELTWQPPGLSMHQLRPLFWIFDSLTIDVEVKVEQDMVNEARPFPHTRVTLPTESMKRSLQRSALSAHHFSYIMETSEKDVHNP
jgi:hypothetical protein